MLVSSVAYGFVPTRIAHSPAGLQSLALIVSPGKSRGVAPKATGGSMRICAESFRLSVGVVLCIMIAAVSRGAELSDRLASGRLRDE